MPKMVAGPARNRCGNPKNPLIWKEDPVAGLHATGSLFIFSSDLLHIFNQTEVAVFGRLQNGRHILVNEGGV